MNIFLTKTYLLTHSNAKQQEKEEYNVYWAFLFQ